MINHFITVVYNRTDATPDGVYNPLVTPLEYPGALQAFAVLRGHTVDSAWSFATWTTKLVEASTFGQLLTEFDRRLTFDLRRLVRDRTNVVDELLRVRNLPPAAIDLALSGEPELARTFRKDDLLQESVSARLVAVVRKITRHNGG